MSAALLESIKDHLQAANLLTGLTVRYYRWTDADLSGAANVIVFRVDGAGLRDSVVQRPDVKILIMVKGENAKTGNEKADAIFANFAGTTKPVGMYKIEPLATVVGPYYLDNGRAVFEINARCFVGDH